MTFTGLWGAPFLKARFGLEPKAAATICSVMLICWAVANPLFGGISDRIGRRKPAYLGGALIATIGWAVMIYAKDLPLSVFTVVAALTSVATGCGVLGFAFGKESVPAQYMGTVTATTNIGNMLGNVLLQPGIGMLLEQALDRHPCQRRARLRRGGLSGRVRADRGLVAFFLCDDPADQRNKLPADSLKPLKSRDREGAVSHDAESALNLPKVTP